MKTAKLILIFCLVGLLLAPIASVGADGVGTRASPRERFGVSVAPEFQGVSDFPGAITDYADIEGLGLGWYSDWHVTVDPARPGGVEYAQLLPTRSWPPDWDLVEKALVANPGSLWMIGHEPETRGQGQHTPAEYAERYHLAYHFIKDRDPSAQVAIGGVVMPTPLRLRWLDLCLEHYRATYGTEMPVDVWNILVHILKEERDDWGCGVPYGLPDGQGRLYSIEDNADSDIFEELVLDFCGWLVERGQRDKPLIISEFGVLMPSSYLPGGDQAVLDYMQDTFDFMISARDPVLGYGGDDHRLVQRWMWFSLNYPFFDDTCGGYNGSLYYWQNPGQLTVFGEFFRDYAGAQTPHEQIVSASADTYIDPARPDSAFGRQGRLEVRTDSLGYGIIALVRFDLSAIPADAHVTSATLLLHPVARSNPQPIKIAVVPAHRAWDDDTTYEAWQQSPVPAAIPPVLVIEELGQVVAHDVTNEVRQWLDGSQDNHGLALRTRGVPNRGNVSYSLAASEWAEGDELGPQLLVQYMSR